MHECPLFCENVGLPAYSIATLSIDNKTKDMLSAYFPAMYDRE